MELRAGFDGNEYASIMLAKMNDRDFLQPEPSALQSVRVSTSGTFPSGALTSFTRQSSCLLFGPR